MGGSEWNDRGWPDRAVDLLSQSETCIFLAAEEDAISRIQILGASMRSQSNQE